jgi:hypothetical protein
MQSHGEPLSVRIANWHNGFLDAERGLRGYQQRNDAIALELYQHLDGRLLVVVRPHGPRKIGTAFTGVASSTRGPDIMSEPLNSKGTAGPWKVTEACWDDLMDGKDEWSSIGKQLRQNELVE